MIENDQDIFSKIKDQDFVEKGGLGDGLNLLLIIKFLQESNQVFKKKLKNYLAQAD